MAGLWQKPPLLFMSLIHQLCQRGPVQQAVGTHWKKAIHHSMVIHPEDWLQMVVNTLYTVGVEIVPLKRIHS
jgi:hypothetical protein